MSSDTIHATTLVIGERGVLIEGRAGTGKTSLALALVEDAREKGRFARLVADDRTVVMALQGRLVASVPATIAGKAEIKGLGPGPVIYEPRAVIDFAVRLVDAADAEDISPEGWFGADGASVPLLVLPQRQVRRNVMTILAALNAI